MNVKFYGVRSGIAAPGFNTAKYGGNTACVGVSFKHSNKLVIFDAGSGIRVLGEQIVRSRKPFEMHLFISHNHLDKLMGFPFFLPNYIEGAEIFIYAPKMIKGSIEESLQQLFQHQHNPVSLGDIKSRWHFHEITEGFLNIGDIEVSSMKLNHPVTCFGYRLEYENFSMVYASDHEQYHAVDGTEVSGHSTEDKHFEKFIDNADLLIGDAQYLPEEYGKHKGWGHGTATYILNAAINAKVRQLAFFQHDPNRTDRQIDQIIKHYRGILFDKEVKLSLFPAQEGLEIELRV